MEMGGAGGVDHQPSGIGGDDRRVAPQPEASRSRAGVGTAGSAS